MLGMNQNWTVAVTVTTCTLAYLFTLTMVSANPEDLQKRMVYVFAMYYLAIKLIDF